MVISLNTYVLMIRFALHISHYRTEIGHYYAHTYTKYVGYDGPYSGLNPNPDNDYDNGIAITFE